MSAAENRKRARTAADVLATFAVAADAGDIDDNPEDVLAFFLCNVRHFADTAGVDFDEANAQGEAYYLDERIEPD